MTTALSRAIDRSACPSRSLLSTRPAAAGASNSSFLAEVLCDSQVQLSPGHPSPCPTGSYPRVTHIVMHRLPTKRLKTMRNPCAGVPSNPWCARRRRR